MLLIMSGIFHIELLKTPNGFCNVVAYKIIIKASPYLLIRSFSLLVLV